MDTITNFRIKKMSLQLQAADLENAIAFYTQNLGFEVEFRYEDFYAGVIKDGHSIHLKEGLPSPEERQSKRQNEDLDIMIEVEDIEQVYEKLLGKSIEIIKALREMPYGKEFYIADPNGYIIGFIGEA